VKTNQARKKELLGSATAPRRHNLDRRASKIADEAKNKSNDELLTTKQLAEWFGVSEQWLEIGRGKNYGPKFIHLAPKVVRYRRGDCLAWLERRTFACTTEYPPVVRAQVDA
jgi:predicted DNA-binding transcriptional regulator AlpA